MPRGTHPNSLANLKKSKGFTTESARKASKKAKELEAERKSWIDVMNEEADNEFKRDAIEMLKKRIRAGNLKALEIYLEWTEQKPVKKVEVSGGLEDQKAKLDSMIEQMRNEQ